MDGESQSYSLTTNMIFKHLKLTPRSLDQFRILNVPDRFRVRTARDHCQIRDKLAKSHLRKGFLEFAKQSDKFLALIDFYITHP